MRSAFETESDEYVVESIVRAKTFDRWLDHCSVFVDESIVTINEDGYTVISADGAEVAMVHTTLHKEAFESHRAGFDGQGSLSIGISLQKLQEVVDLMGSDDIMSMGFDEESGSLHIRGGGIKRSIGLIDTNAVQNYRELPDVDHSTVVTVPKDQFTRGIKSISLVSDQIIFRWYDGESESREKGLYFYGEGDNDDTLYEPEGMQVHENGACHTILSIKYLEDIMKVIPNGEAVLLEQGEHIPMNFIFSFDEEIDGTDETRTLIDSTYCIAPRLVKD